MLPFMFPFVFCIMESLVVLLLVFCADAGKSAPTKIAATKRTKRQTNLLAMLLLLFIVMSSSDEITRRTSQADG